MITAHPRFRRAFRRWTPFLLLAFVHTPMSAFALTADEMLDEMQERAFNYFWLEANPVNGVVKDRSTASSPGKMAATGFGLSAICIGIDHGWVTREAGRERILAALRTLWFGPQGPELQGNIGYKGFFYHFVDLNTAVRTWDCDLAPIDTALLFAGIIDARQYFDTDVPLDVELRNLADDIVQRADWTFMYNGQGIALTWWPESGLSPITWLGYNEAMLMYLLAIGSSTHPIPPSTWQAWTGNYQWADQYGYSFVVFPPLFGHQYSHCWIDFRDIQDDYMRARGITYFENSRRATLAARAYCIDNPYGWDGYGENIWGLTASDDPQHGYIAHGAPPAQHDNGTITPTAAAGSLPFAPEVVIPALLEMYDAYGAELWSTYGFKDAFNPTLGWVAADFLGIDQGPIIIMIENYRTGAVWDRIMRYPDIQQGLSRAGFRTVSAVETGGPTAEAGLSLRNEPNPFNPSTTIRYQLAAPEVVDLRIYNATGRLVKILVDGRTVVAGDHAVAWRGRDDRERQVAAGVYFYRLEAGEYSETKRMALVK
jgi:hypothetical protein